MHGFGRVLLCGEICAGCVGILLFGWLEVDLSVLSARTSEGGWRKRGGGRVSVTGEGIGTGRRGGREEVLVIRAWCRLD